MKTSQFSRNVESVILAAQYLRMSTDLQQYSIENQKTAIEGYASIKGFQVIKTYMDSGRSGLLMKTRTGLNTLLKDVLGGNVEYKAILVFDVSRWGRFQDMDEAAHYEFLCRHAGIPIHYCAEQFTNDGTMSNSILKAMKRTMAAEFSRELGEKVFVGQSRLAQMGFRMGGVAGYGLRRALFSKEGKYRQTLQSGECKSLTTDRIKLTCGPEEEVSAINLIYDMKLTERMNDCAIARKLNATGVPFLRGKQWTNYAVGRILTNLKYAGYNTYAVTSRKLSGPTIKKPREEWVVKPGAFPAIIEPQKFANLQNTIKYHADRTTPKRLILGLKRLLKAKGKLSEHLIANTKGLPSPSTYFHVLGNFRDIYKMVGYTPDPSPFIRSDTRIVTMRLRAELFARLKAQFPERIEIARESYRFRCLLRVDQNIRVSVIICRRFRTVRRARWILHPALHETGYITLICRLNSDNSAIEFFDLAPQVKQKTALKLASDCRQLGKLHRLNDLSEFCDLVDRINRNRSRRQYMPAPVNRRRGNKTDKA